MAGDGFARGDPDTDVGVAECLPQLLAHLPRRGECLTGEVVEVQRCTEDGERGVALEFVHESTVASDDGHHHPEELVQQVDDLSRWPIHGQPRRADDVDEQYADVAFLAAEFCSGLDGLARDVLADVPAEQVAQLLPLTQVGDHVVEARLQKPQVGAVVDLDGDVQVAFAHSGLGGAELLDGVVDGANDAHDGQQTERQRRQTHPQDGA